MPSRKEKKNRVQLKENFGSRKEYMWSPNNQFMVTLLGGELFAIDPFGDAEIHLTDAEIVGKIYSLENLDWRPSD